MNTTKILGEAVGIQSQGTVDKTETQTNEGLTSALIIGRFKRGRVDKPMTIHQGNIRGQLGYEPNNIDYQAVQDCLDTGVPSIQVLRVGTDTCDCKSDIVIFDDVFNIEPMPYGDANYTLIVNGVSYQARHASTTAISLELGLSSVFEINSSLNNLLSFYIGSSNGGQLFLANQLNACTTISLKVVHQSSYEGAQTAERTYIDNIFLCAKGLSKEVDES